MLYRVSSHRCSDIVLKVLKDVSDYEQHPSSKRSGWRTALIRTLAGLFLSQVGGEDPSGKDHSGEDLAVP